LIGTEPLEQIIETVVNTSKMGFPLSVILIGPSGCGKSSLICKYSGIGFCRTDSISSQGLYDICERDNKNEIKYIIIPDFNPTMSRKSSTVDGTLANLLTLTADGTTRIDDGRSKKEYRHDPIGLITAATTEMYAKHERKWYNLGLRRRIMPLFYRYSRETLSRIQDSVDDKSVILKGLNVIEYNFFEDQQRVHIADVKISEKHTAKIRENASILALYMGKTRAWDGDGRGSKWFTREVLPITPHLALQSIVCANALKNKRMKVTDEDIDFMLKFMRFCDPEHPCEL